MRIILLNGPPSSGKDTAARALASHLLHTQTEYSVLRMSHPTKRAFAGVVNARIDEWGNVENWEDQKKAPIKPKREPHNKRLKRKVAYLAANIAALEPL